MLPYLLQNSSVPLGMVWMRGIIEGLGKSGIVWEHLSYPSVYILKSVNGSDRLFRSGGGWDETVLQLAGDLHLRQSVGSDVSAEM